MKTARHLRKEYGPGEILLPEQQRLSWLWVLAKKLLNRFTSIYKISNYAIYCYQKGGIVSSTLSVFYMDYDSGIIWNSSIKIVFLGYFIIYINSNSNESAIVPSKSNTSVFTISSTALSYFMALILSTDFKLFSNLSVRFQFKYIWNNQTTSYHHILFS